MRICPRIGIALDIGKFHIVFFQLDPNGIRLFIWGREGEIFKGFFFFGKWVDSRAESLPLLMNRLAHWRLMFCSKWFR